MNYLTSEQNNPVDNLIEIYNSDYCITLDELPDWSTYSPEQAEAVRGDVNANGKFEQSDAVLMKNFLIALPTAKLTDPAVGDMNGDKKLNVYDLLIMKRELLGKQ